MKAMLFSSFARLGWILFSSLSLLAQAQVAPRIDPGTVRLRDGLLTLQFEAGLGDPADFQLERGGPIELPSAWMPASDAVITALGPDRFQAALPMAARTAEFLRSIA